MGGNWKCNGSVTAVSTLVTDLNASSSQVPPGIDVVVVPPFVYLDYVVSHLDKEKYQVGSPEQVLTVDKLTQWRLPQIIRECLSI